MYKNKYINKDSNSEQIQNFNEDYLVMPPNSVASNFILLQGHLKISSCVKIKNKIFHSLLREKWRIDAHIRAIEKEASDEAYYDEYGPGSDDYEEYDGDPYEDLLDGEWDAYWNID